MCKGDSIQKPREQRTALSRSRVRQWRKRLESDLGRPVASTGTRGFVYLVIDSSFSMEAAKLAAAKKGAMDFALEARSKGCSIGLIQFGSSATHLCGLQEDISLLRPYIEELTAGGSTNMADAIHMGTEELSHKRGYRAMVIVTDGMPDSEEAALAAAEKAKKNGMDIIAIGTDDANREFLERLASRAELGVKVPREQLGRAITSSAEMLPQLTGGQPRAGKGGATPAHRPGPQRDENGEPGSRGDWNRSAVRVAALPQATFEGTTDETPLTLSIKGLGAICIPVIKRGMTIPVCQSAFATTTVDNQSSLEIHVLQGERRMAADNRTLARFAVDGIPAAPRGVPQIEIIFSIDADGILSLAASDRVSGQKLGITRIVYSGGLSQVEIDEIIREARKHEQNGRDRTGRA